MDRKNQTLFSKLVLVLIALGALASAQVVSTEIGTSVGGSAVAVTSPGIPLQAKVGMMSVRVDNLDASPVKGTPFCGTITSEHTQAFADGNRIHTVDSSTICRDSEGRIRREAEVTLLGAASKKDLPKIVTIIDPVAGARYMLDSNLKIARKMPIEPFALPPDAAGKAHGQVAYVLKRDTHVDGATFGDNMMYTAAEPVTIAKRLEPGSRPGTPNIESLGDQTIGGIHATGTRVKTTIPAGNMGNEQPIVVESETWSSPELKATVMTKHSDPWAGELKTQLTNVSYSEPDASLFTIPSDYKIVDEKPFQIKLPPPPPHE